MCVFLEIDVPGIPRSQAGSVSREAMRQRLLEIDAQRRPKSTRGARFLLGPRDHPYACALGAGRVDGAEGLLSFDPKRPVRIEMTLRFLFSRATAHGMWIHCVYVGGAHDRVPRKTTAESTLEELLAGCRHDRVGENVCCHVRGEAA